MIRSLAVALAALLAGAAAARPVPHAPAPAAPPPPVPYTAAQAAEGAQVYAQRCAMCHGWQLEGTFEVPALTGKFVANWAGRPIGELTAYLGRAMPQFAPGTLAPEDTARLVAHILAASGYPAGARSLPVAGAEQARIVLPAAPAPH